MKSDLVSPLELFQPEMPQAMLQHDHRDRLRRGNIVPRREIRLLGIAEHLPQRLGRRSDDKASTHFMAQPGFSSGAFNPIG